MSECGHCEATQMRPGPFVSPYRKTFWTELASHPVKIELPFKISHCVS